MEQKEFGENESSASASPAEAKREVSSIAFPYGDLDDAVEFARAVHEVGGQSCLVEQLAGYLKVASSGGAFRAKMAPPRIFGLIAYERNEISLTPLGMRIVDNQTEKAARVDAFLNVGLYHAIYTKYKGFQLPPPAALEREMAKLGVSTKQTDRARQVFERSAKQAGFFWAGSDRLTLPVTRETRPIEENQSTSVTEALVHPVASTGSASYHPFIEGLLKTLPETGSEWAVKDRAKWLRLAANAFDLIYTGDGEIEIKAVAP